MKIGDAVSPIMHNHFTVNCFYSIFIWAPSDAICSRTYLYYSYSDFVKGPQLSYSELCTGYPLSFPFP